MLETVGVRSVGDLLAHVPHSLLDRAHLDLPAGLGEMEVLQEMASLATANRTPPSFQGAGCYRHFVPSAVSRMLERSEFATAYTPYQPEVSQGTLQATFEFQTYVSILTGLDVANASLYDGASALAEAVLMALRIAKGRERVLISAGVHPEYRAVVETYLDGYGRGCIEEVPLGPDGATDMAALEEACGSDVAVVCTGYPNVYGVIDDLTAASRLAHANGALSVSVTAESLALALLQSPGKSGADIAVAEGQSLGLPLSYGGPGVGLFAASQEYLRQMPGRLVGETVDGQGRRGYVLTLSTREQHIRREKATSNICTNQGLATLAITVFLSLAGRRGLRELALLNASRAHQVAQRLDREAGLATVFDAPFFNEFVIDEPLDPGWWQRALDAGVIPGVRLGELIPGCTHSRGRLLVTVTECCSDADIDTLVGQLSGQAAA
jgi:glycine dehydrogenase subunit 1